MDVAMGARPDVNLIVHVIKVGRAAEVGRQGRHPLTAIDAPWWVAGAREVEQRHMRVVRIVAGNRRFAVAFQDAVPLVGVKRVDLALGAILLDLEAATRADPGYPGEHADGHHGIPSRSANLRTAL